MSFNRLKKFFALFMVIGLVHCSRAGDLTALTNPPTPSSSPKVLTANGIIGKKSIVFFRENWKHRSLRLFAVYEEPWRDSAVAAKIFDGHQEGGCAFIKASFSF